MKDRRRTFDNARVQGATNVWTVDAKYDPDRDEVKVYRVRGDVTDTKGFRDAIRQWKSANGFPNATVRVL